eukprot:8744454-Pyramimonas_sp.AAC.1
MGARNFQIIMKLAERLRGVNMPYIVGGDFNCTPHEVLESGTLKYFEADMFHPTVATFSSGRTIDFFVVSNQLVVDEVEALVDIQISTHSHVPVRLQVSSDAVRPRVCIVPVPRAFPVDRPIGCQRGEHDSAWTDVGQEVEAQLLNCNQNGSPTGSSTRP